MYSYVSWVVTQRYRSFGTTYWSHLKGSSCPKNPLTLEDGTKSAVPNRRYQITLRCVITQKMEGVISTVVEASDHAQFHVLPRQPRRQLAFLSSARLRRWSGWLSLPLKNATSYCRMAWTSTVPRSSPQRPQFRRLWSAPEGISQYWATGTLTLILAIKHSDAEQSSYSPSSEKPGSYPKLNQFTDIYLVIIIYLYSMSLSPILCC